MDLRALHQGGLRPLAVLRGAGHAPDKTFFGKGLQDAGALQQLEVGAAEFKVKHAQRSLAKARSDLAAPQALHRDVLKLREEQARQALVVLEGSDGAATAKADEGHAALAVAPPPKARRPRVSRAKTEIHSCFRCGKPGHTAATCLKTVAVPKAAERRLVQKAHLKNNVLAALVSRVKYTNPNLRSAAYESRQKAQCKVQQRRCFLDMARQTPLAMVLQMRSDGLFCDLHFQMENM